MPIIGVGWEILIVRKGEQTRDFGKIRHRTVGTYQVYHDGVAQTGKDLSGTVAEARGPGDNTQPENGKRVEPGRYPMATQYGTRYLTIGYKDSLAPNVVPKPGLELKKTGNRTEILIHPGYGFLSSIGCINPCTRLPNAQEMMDFPHSRERVIALIEDLRAYLGAKFPKDNALPIPKAFAVIEGEP